MSAEDIQDRVKRNGIIDSGKVNDEFLEAFSQVLLQFLRDFQSGHIKVESVTDLQRIYLFYKELINYKEKMEEDTSAQGAAPEIRANEHRALSSSNVIERDDSGEEKVDLNNLSQDDLGKMLDSMTKAMNTDNMNETKSSSSPSSKLDGDAQDE